MDILQNGKKIKNILSLLLNKIFLKEKKINLDFLT